MGYRWKPNATQRREFAQRMQDPVEREAYEKRKAEKKLYDNWKYKDFIPTKEQFNFCLNHMNLFVTQDEINAMNLLMSAYTSNEKVNHCYIHIVNEKRRNYDRTSNF
jgi:predicted nucleotidyltransferase component of viral defense system